MNASLKFFFEHVLKTGLFLEIGTKRSQVDRPTHHKSLFPDASEYIMTDFDDGIDVDQVSDLHTLSTTFGENRFDAIFCASVFEHLEQPWIAAAEILKVLKPGGVFFVQTHQAFPIHGYPSFYFTFSDAAMASLFKDAADVTTAYEFPCTITPGNPDIVWNPAAPSFLNVCVSGVKR